MTTPQSTSLSFSSEDLPARERLTMWREIYARTILKVDMEQLGDDPFRCDAKVSTRPGLGIASIAAPRTRIARTRTLIAGSGTDMILVKIPLQGSATISQLGREVVAHPGEAVPMATSEPAGCDFSPDSRRLIITVPSAALMPMIGRREDVVMRKVPRDTAALRQLIGYAGLLQQGHSLNAPELQQHEVSHVYDLIALALGATRDAGEVAKGRGARAARFAAVRADVLANLTQVRLSPAMIARRHGITDRQVHRLFAAAGGTFSAFVMEARLDRAHELLLSPSYVHRSISDIAHGVGFGELTTFNRAFRRRYGDTPSAVRAGLQRLDA